MSGTVNLSGYHLTFDDEFDTPADLAPFDNAYYWGGTTIPSNNELENYVPSNSTTANPYSVANGALTITASPTPSGGLPYTSGLLTTQNTFSQNTGYFEIRAEMPQNSGFWPAFWMLPEGAGYPEIDIMEQPDNSGTNSDYWIHTSTPTNSSGGFQDVGTNVFAGYHTYGFLWTGTTIQYTFDGQLIGTPQATPPALAAEQMYLLANLAVGGWPPAPASGASSTYSIDYIRAYSNDPNVPVVAQEPVSNPDLIGATVGSGPDALVLQMSGDAYQGSPQFTVSVDGVQQGGVQTVTAQLGQGQAEAFTVLGAFGTSQHTVTVNFLNDAYGGSSSLDRNLYVDEATINGSPVANSGLTELTNGPQSFSFVGNDTTTTGSSPPPTNPAPLTIGSGPDQLTLSMSEDQYLDNAQFTVSVDGVQQGGVQTVSAVKGLGEAQQFIIQGAFGTSQHTVTVNFLNDAYGGSAGLDRNLYVNGATIDGTAIPNSSLNEFGDGPQSFSFTGNDAASGSQAPPPASNPSPVTIGTGADQLVLQMSEDQYLGDAQFTISVDGVQQGGTQTTTASHGAGQEQAFDVQGTFAPGPHTVAVAFLNDAFGGTAALDRNLYVNGATIDGTAIANSSLSELGDGLQSFGFTEAGTTPPVTGTGSPPAPVTIGSGPDTFLFSMAEDAYLGNAQFTISVDGVQQGGVQTTTALQSQGQTQTFAVEGNFGPGAHTETVNFTNDAFGGSATLDRNLYVDGITYDNVPTPNSTATLLANGPVSFATPATTQATPDTLTVDLTEDAYQGDATASISIDGTKLGTPTVTFLHSGGTQEQFTYTGDFGGAGVAHNVAVSFTNDAYGGSPTLDRNLYVGGLTFDGTSYPQDQSAMFGNGTVNFSIPATLQATKTS